MIYRKNHKKLSRFSMVFILVIIVTSSIYAVFAYSEQPIEDLENIVQDEEILSTNLPESNPSNVDDTNDVNIEDVNCKRTNILENNPISISALENYNMDDSYIYNWIDATGGTMLSLSDDSAATIALPFSFTFYDQSFTNLYVSSNGWISFNNTNPIGLSIPSIPSTDVYFHYSIAIFLDDLYPSNNVYYQFLSGPNRVVVSYVDINHLYSSLAGSFEIILFETGEILFQYDYIDDVGNHTAGLNYGLDASYYNQYTGLTDTTEDLAILFSTEDPEHELIVNLNDIPNIPIGDSILVNATVMNYGLSNESDVELQLWINDILVDNNSYPTLVNGTSQTLHYLWTPATIGFYNITAYTVPVADEYLSINNNETIFVSVYDPTDMKVAILNYDGSTRPTYWTGGWANNYFAIYNGLLADGIGTKIVTNDDVLLGGLADVSILIMIDNAPNDAASTVIKNWSFSGGHIISFDSSICFTNWAGILPPEAEGTNGQNTYWDYGSPSTGIVVEDHPIVNGYSLGTTIYGTSSDAQYYSSVMQASLAGPYYTPIVKTDIGSDFDLIVTYEPTTGQGFVVQIWDANQWITITNQLLILNTIYWLQGIDVSVFVDLLYPAGGETLSGEIEISWISEGFNLTNLNYSLLLWDDISDIWNPIVDEITETDYLWNTTTVVDGLYKIRVIATNGTCIRRDQSALFRIENVNFAPIVSIIQPITGSIHDFDVTIIWSASDPDGDILIFNVDYWNSTDWVELANGLTTNGYIWDTLTVPNGVNYKIRVFATDIEYTVMTETGYFKINNPFITTIISGIEFVITIVITATTLGIVSRFLKRKKL